MSSYEKLSIGIKESRLRCKGQANEKWADCRKQAMRKSIEHGKEAGMSAGVIKHYMA